MLQREASAFVTGGAVFGIKLVGRDAEHIVALDAHAVKDGTDNSARLDGIFWAGWVLGGGLLGARIGRHAAILARGSCTPTGGGQHLSGASGASSICGKCWNPGTAEPRAEGALQQAQASTGYGESRAALARMKYLGACQTRPSKPRKIMRNAAP
jgi:hypothetical protein